MVWPIGVYSVWPSPVRIERDDDFAGIHTNADRDRRFALGAKFRGILAQLVLHPQRRVERSQRVILVGDGRTEQRENAIAGRLHDVAVVVLHRVDHEAQRWIDDAAGFLGVELLHQFGGALDIGEQGGDGFAFALQRAGIGYILFRCDADIGDHSGRGRGYG